MYMTNNITDYNSLQEEKQRLQALVLHQRGQIKSDLALIREQAQPVTNLFSSIASVTNKPAAQPLLKLGVEMGIDVLLRKTLFRNAGMVSKLLMPIAMRVMSSNILSGKARIWAQAITDKISEKFRK